MKQSNKLNTTAAVYAMMVFGLLGFFFLSLNPSETATQSQFFIGLLGSKAAMLACWAVAAKCYRKLYC